MEPIRFKVLKARQYWAIIQLVSGELAEKASVRIGESLFLSEMIAPGMYFLEMIDLISGTKETVFEAELYKLDTYGGPISSPFGENDKP